MGRYSVNHDTEAERVATSHYRSFLRTLDALTKVQKIIATKLLLATVRELLEKLERA